MRSLGLIASAASLLCGCSSDHLSRESLAGSKWLGVQEDAAGVKRDLILEFTDSLAILSDVSRDRYLVMGDTIVMMTPLGAMRVLMHGDSIVSSDLGVTFRRAH